MICIIDYQSGNLGAIVNMFKRIGVKAEISSNPQQLENASKVILPGIGTFDIGMKNLLAGGWMPMLNRKVFEEGVPTLGICLGMQLMTEGSDEGQLSGLGWVKGRSRRFVFENEDKLKVPHMGWNAARQIKESRLLDRQSRQEHRFYFAHGYYVELQNNEDQLLQTTYGFPFSSAFEKDNIIGVQFHPEKSHRFGMDLLHNFAVNF